MAIWCLMQVCDNVDTCGNNVDTCGNNEIPVEIMRYLWK